MADNGDLSARQSLAAERQCHPDAFCIADAARHVRHAIDALAAWSGAPAPERDAPRGRFAACSRSCKRGDASCVFGDGTRWMANCLRAMTGIDPCRAAAEAGMARDRGAAGRRAARNSRDGPSGDPAGGRHRAYAAAGAIPMARPEHVIRPQEPITVCLLADGGYCRSPAGGRGVTDDNHRPYGTSRTRTMIRTACGRPAGSTGRPDR